MTEPQRLYHLALRDFHAAAGARFRTRGGWSVPADYGDARAEHGALRESAAVFDRSDRSRFIVTGTDAQVVLDAVFAGHVHDLEEGRAMRTVVLDVDGKIGDLALVTRTGGIAYMVTGEPGQRMETLARLRAAVGPGFDAQIDDRTETTCLLALAGPAAEQVAREHLSEGLPARIQSLHNVMFEFHGFRALATRTSDVGEDGFELMLAPAVAQHVLETLRTAGVALAGDVAFESARVEACIPAFDPDLAGGLTPAQADLDAVLGVPGGDEGVILSAMLVDGDEPLPAGAEVAADGARVGEVRSCVQSFALDATVALAVIDTDHALPGTALTVGRREASVVAKPFFRRRR